MAEELTKVTRNISIDAETDSIVEIKAGELATMTGDRNNYSAAIRFIVREWLQLKKLAAKVQNLQKA